MAVVFIGDELTATGLGLAGIVVMMPAAADVASAFDEACRQGSAVLLSSALVPHVPVARLEAALMASQPLVAIVPEITGTSPLPDLVRRLKTTLGIEA